MGSFPLQTSYLRLFRMLFYPFYGLVRMRTSSFLNSGPFLFRRLSSSPLEGEDALFFEVEDPFPCELGDTVLARRVRR